MHFNFLKSIINNTNKINRDDEFEKLISLIYTLQVIFTTTSVIFFLILKLKL